MLRIYRGNHLALPRGDTALLRVQIAGAQLGDADRAVFAVYDRFEERELLRKTAAISGGAAAFALKNADTKDIAPGRYRYDVRVVRDPVYEAGEIAGGREVHSLFAAGGLPAIDIEEVGAHV